MNDTNSSGENQTRQQLTLFIQDNREIVEKIRRQFNPDQYKIISAHVTLCREDEISLIDEVISNLTSLKFDSPLAITFGEVDRFDDGRGVWLPARAENKQFQDLRVQILRGLIDTPRKLRPHVTLMHPRNSTCTDAIFEQILMHEFPTEFLFDEISLIEQKDGGKWNIIDQFKI